MKESIKIHDKTFKPFLSHEEILKSIDSVAAKINADFAGCEDVPIILCVLNGAIVFTGELLQRLDFNCELVSVKMSSIIIAFAVLFKLCVTSCYLLFFTYFLSYFQLHIYNYYIFF